MAYILGIPTIKRTSQKTLSVQCSLGFIPIAGVAVTLTENGIVPFDGVSFYGFAVEYNRFTKSATVIVAGIGVPVQAEPNVNIIHSEDIFISANGKVDLAGVQVNGFNELINVNAISASTGVSALNAVTVSFGVGMSIIENTPPPLFDFNQQDFLSGDFA